MSQHTKQPHGKATSPAPKATPPAGAKSGPCKLSPVAGRPSWFSVSSANMPIDCRLDSPDAKTELLSVQVFKSDSGDLVDGQPTAFSATNFTLDLPAGDYMVVVVVGSLPSAAPVWIVEDCAGATKLDWIVVPVNTSGEFSLKVS